MPTDRKTTAIKVDLYAQMLLDGAYEEGLNRVYETRVQITAAEKEEAARLNAQDAVLEVRANLWRAINNIRARGLELAAALRTTPLTPEQRRELAYTMTEGCHPIFRDVFTVMSEREELGLLTRVRDAYEKKLEAKLNVIIVDVTTVTKLDDHLYNLIKEKAEEELHSEIIIRERIDESLLGGVTMRVHGRLIDASVAHELERMRYRLKKREDGGEQ